MSKAKNYKIDSTKCEIFFLCILCMYTRKIPINVLRFSSIIKGFCWKHFSEGTLTGKILDENKRNKNNKKIMKNGKLLTFAKSNNID